MLINKVLALLNQYLRTKTYQHNSLNHYAKGTIANNLKISYKYCFYKLLYFLFHSFKGSI